MVAMVQVLIKLFMAEQFFRKQSVEYNSTINLFTKVEILAIQTDR